jgi:hypothetical protein
LAASWSAPKRDTFTATQKYNASGTRLPYLQRAGGQSMQQAAATHIIRRMRACMHASDGRPGMLACHVECAVQGVLHYACEITDNTSTQRSRLGDTCVCVGGEGG